MNPVEIALEGLALTGTRVGCFDAVDAFIDSQYGSGDLLKTTLFQV